MHPGNKTMCQTAEMGISRFRAEAFEKLMLCLVCPKSILDKDWCTINISPNKIKNNWTAL